MSAHATTPAPALSPWTVRGTLALDAAVTGANGLAYLALSGPLGGLLGLGRSTLFGLGFFLTAYALLVAALAARPRPHRLAVLAVVDLNAAWTVLSLAALATRLEPTTAGAVWIPAQAAVVALFAGLQLAALRRESGGSGA
ncbi:hypothetical protein [Kitasatospora sp. NPDC101183]|uniref:hypothetical protein n=1 Tax=Kitasatospora sp. NPDC101183 TaxID=3364100 RepID=UPI003827B958